MDVFTIARRGDQYTMTDAQGQLLYTARYTRAPKARRGVLTVEPAGGGAPLSITERLTDLAVWRGEERLLRVGPQPDLRPGRRRVHIQIPESGLLCDGTPREGYTLFSPAGALGSFTFARTEDGDCYLCGESEGIDALALFALAFAILRKC